MGAIWGILWREILVGSGVAQGLFLRLHVDPTGILIDIVGSMTNVELTFLTVLDVVAFGMAVGKSFEYAYLPGVLAFFVAIWAGYILPVNPRGAIFWLLFVLLLSLFGVLWQEDRR